MFKNSRASTTNVVSVGSVTNNSASNFNLSFTGPENATSLASLKARGFSPTVYCDVKDDYDWGQSCSDGICQYECESIDDCIRLQKCKKGWREYKEKPCVWMPCDRKCLELLADLSKESPG